MRLETDRRVRQVMKAIDHAIALRGDDPNVVECVASNLITIGATAEAFHRWSEAGLRAVVFATAMNAPDDDLAAMAIQAKREIAWVTWWHDEGRAKAEGLSPEEHVREVTNQLAGKPSVLDCPEEMRP